MTKKKPVGELEPPGKKVVGPFVDPPRKRKSRPKVELDEQTCKGLAPTMKKALARVKRTRDEALRDAEENKRKGEELKALHAMQTKARLFDLMERFDKMRRARISRSLTFEFSSATPFQPDFGAPSDITGIQFGFDEPHRTDSKRFVSKLITLYLHSETWEFDIVDEALDRIQARYEEEQQEIRERDAELRKLSEAQRIILGFGHWKDPLTE